MMRDAGRLGLHPSFCSPALQGFAKTLGKVTPVRVQRQLAADSEAHAQIPHDEAQERALFAPASAT